MRGGRREAERVDAELTPGRGSEAGKVTVSELLDLWMEQHTPSWSPSSVENHKSRVAQVKADPIAKVRLAKLSTVDVDRWHSRLARNGVGDGSIRNQHQVLRAAVTQAVRWGWVMTNVVAVAQLGRRKQVPRALGEDDVRRVLAASEELADALEVEPAAPIALRLAAITGARRSELAALRWEDLDGDRLSIDSSVAIIRYGTPEAPSTPTLRDAPYGSQVAFPLEDIAATATGVVLEAFSSRVEDDEVARRVTTDVADIMDAFELAGVVRRIGAVDPGDSRQTSGGSVVLTPAGVVCARRLLADAGYDIPLADRFAGGNATDLLMGTDGEGAAVVYGEVMAWRATREPGQAAAEMSDAVRELDDPALRVLGLTILGEIGSDVAMPYVRELALEPGTRGFALCWLVDHGKAMEEELFDPSDGHGFVDVLGCRMVTGGPDSLISTLALAGDHGRQVDVIAGMWRAPSLMTELVLTAVSQVHPSKVVAKAAGKALFKRRSSCGDT